MTGVDVPAEIRKVDQPVTHTKACVWKVRGINNWGTGIWAWDLGNS